jgi:hypothetical protein
LLQAQHLYYTECIKSEKRRSAQDQRFSHLACALFIQAQRGGISIGDSPLCRV